MKVLALILARGGSKRIPLKNIKKIAGRPLIAYSILAARKSKFVDKIIVSTDSLKIKDISEKYGAECPFLRPPELSTDTATSNDAIIHAIRFLADNSNYHPDYVILLQPTSPLRKTQEIDTALEITIQKGQDSLISVCESFTLPQFIMKMENNRLIPVVVPPTAEFRRQDFPQYYQLNGSIYIFTPDKILTKNTIRDESTIPFICDKDTSFDIDEPLDFEIVSAFLKNQNLKQKQLVRILQNDIGKGQIFYISDIELKLGELKEALNDKLRIIKDIGFKGILIRNLSDFSKLKILQIQEICQKLSCAMLFAPKNIEEFESMKSKCEVACYFITPEALLQLDLLKNIAQAKKPIILSPGKLSPIKVDVAIAVIEKERNSQIIITPRIEETKPHSKRSEMKRIRFYRTFNPYFVGMVDYSENWIITAQAVALGVDLIIKPIDLNKLAEAKEYLENIKIYRQNLGLQ